MTTPIEDAWSVFYDALVHRGTAFSHALADYEAALAAADATVAQAAAAFRALLTEQPPPPPPGGVIPADANLVRIGTATFPLAAVNPTPSSNPAGAPYPGCRGPNQLVAYQTPATASGTNSFGRECTVLAGRATGPTVVNAGPLSAGVYVLSGHGTAAAWLDANVRAGSVIEVSKVDGPPVPPPPVVVEPAPRVVAGYLQDGQDVDAIPACYNQVRVAFVRMAGGQLKPVEWGGKTPAQTQAQLTGWAGTKGNQVLLSVGGSGGGSNLGDVSAFTSGFRAIQGPYAASGLDFDEEGGALNEANAVAIAKDLAKGRESTFTLSFVPPGGDPVAVYLRVAVACKNAGIRVNFGFQAYDAVDSDDDILGRTADAVAAIGAPSVLIGCMVGSDPKHRTPDQIESLMRKVVGRWKDIGGVYAWQLAAPGTTEAMTRAAAVLGL